ncbi:MAG: sigma-70 family RNA polymerase sigma factor [Gammaproteobacteria bacterium]|nr:sigma-70 family RNA polymerase sigma factor [Gammaproteobacteria bacterium]
MDNDQLDLLRNGDQALFAQLVRDHHRALIALVTPIAGSSEAEEVVQNAWVKAHGAIASFQGRANIRTWLGRIAINEAKMQLRARKKELLFADLSPDQAHSDPLADNFRPGGQWQQPPANWHCDSPDALLMEADLADCLARLLTGMPANQRAVLEMRDSSELPFDEICNTLAVSASNARVLLHRARAELFKLVNHYQETGEC